MNKIIETINHIADTIKIAVLAIFDGEAAMYEVSVIPQTPHE